MPSPLTHTQFSELIKKLLKMLDNYNSSDLTRSTTSTDSNSSGEVAGIAVNLGLHTCYDLVKDSKYLKSYPTTVFSSIADQDYIDLDTEAYLDEIEAINDHTQNLKLIRKSWGWYRKHFPNPSQTTGNPVYYIRRDNRIYLAPRPSSVINYTVDFVKLTKDLSLDADCPLLPSHYDYWILAEAMVEWYKMEDIHNIPQTILLDRADKRAIATNAIMSNYDLESESSSHWNEGEPYSYPYRRPI